MGRGKILLPSLGPNKVFSTETVLTTTEETKSRGSILYTAAGDVEMRSVYGHGLPGYAMNDGKGNRAECYKYSGRLQPRPAAP